MKIHLRKRLGSLSADNEKKGKKQMSSLYLSFNLKKGDKTKVKVKRGNETIEADVEF